jgi:hypothetical protein
MADDVQSLEERCGTSRCACYGSSSDYSSGPEDQTGDGLVIHRSGALEGKYSQIYVLDRDEQIHICEDGTPVFKLHARFESIFFTLSARVAMARSSESQSDESTDKSLGVMDCEASITITGSFLSCLDVKEHKTIIETAKKGESIVATHACRKTYFVKNRVGDMVSITTAAIYVKGFIQDLIAGKSLSREIRIILDEDPVISGLYSLNEQKEAKYQYSIPFLSEPWTYFIYKWNKWIGQGSSECLD